MNNGQVSDFQRGEGNSTIAMRLTQGEITCMTDWERNDVHHNNQLLARGFLGASGWGALALIPPGVSLNEPQNPRSPRSLNPFERLHRKQKSSA